MYGLGLWEACIVLAPSSPGLGEAVMTRVQVWHDGCQHQPAGTWHDGGG